MSRAKIKPPSISELKKQGYTVEIRHFRYYGKKKYSFNDAPPGKSPNPRGGLTLLTLITPDQFTIKAYAKCMKTENFNKKRAVDIVLGRALKTYREITGICEKNKSSVLLDKETASQSIY